MKNEQEFLLNNSTSTRNGFSYNESEDFSKTSSKFETIMKILTFEMDNDEQRILIFSNSSKRTSNSFKFLKNIYKSQKNGKDLRSFDVKFQDIPSICSIHPDISKNEIENFLDASKYLDPSNQSTPADQKYAFSEQYPHFFSKEAQCEQHQDLNFSFNKIDFEVGSLGSVLPRKDYSQAEPKAYFYCALEQACSTFVLLESLIFAKGKFTSAKKLFSGKIDLSQVKDDGEATKMIAEYDKLAQKKFWGFCAKNLKTRRGVAKDNEGCEELKQEDDEWFQDYFTFKGIN